MRVRKYLLYVSVNPPFRIWPADVMPGSNGSRIVGEFLQNVSREKRRRYPKRPFSRSDASIILHTKVLCNGRVTYLTATGSVPRFWGGLFSAPFPPEPNRRAWPHFLPAPAPSLTSPRPLRWYLFWLLDLSMWATDGQITGDMLT
jgi:hypothetical protein